MKNRKSYYSLLLALVLCLCLTACGGSGDTIDDGGEDYGSDEVSAPDSFEGMVKDSELVFSKKFSDLQNSRQQQDF